MISAALAQQFFTKLDLSRSFLLVSHPDPDGDTLGSSCAMAVYLREKRKNVVQFCATEANGKFWYLPSIQHLTCDVKIFEDPFDVICVLDSGDLRYAEIEGLIQKIPVQPFVINVDHHPTNENFGDLNIVFPEKSSTAEIILELFAAADKKTTKDLATCFLTGLLTDTGSFTNAATTASVFKACADLMLAGAPAHLIREAIHKDKSILSLKLAGRAFERAQHVKDINIMVVWITKKDLEEFGASSEDVTGITKLFQLTNDINYGLFLRENDDGTIKGSLRTVKNDVDVSKLACTFGGGGHMKASGFTIEGSLTLEKLDNIINTLRKQSYANTHSH